MKNKSLILFSILILSTLLMQCQCSEKPTEPTTDTTPPTVISTTPQANAINVSITDSLIIVFSEKIQAESVTSGSVSISNKASTATLTDSIIVVTFSTSLSYSTNYTVTITTTISDLAGNSLDSNFSFSFTTEADPATIPPTVVSTYPINGTTIGSVSDSVRVTFSKDINITTLNDTTFISADGRTGTISYNSVTRTAAFLPTEPFAFDSTYIFRITTNLKDTYGNNLQSQFIWSFSTPTVIPQVSIFNPLSDSVIIGDTLTFFAVATSPVNFKIDSVQFYIDDVYVGVDNISTAKYILDASAYTIGSEHTMYAVGFDSLGNFGYSDTLTFFYLWELVMTDGADGYTQLEVPNDLRKMFVRSTDSTLEFRYEYVTTWDSAYWDTSVDLALFLDTDFSSATGRRTNGGDTINDIGAEYRILIGLHGADTAFHQWQNNCTDSVCWLGLKTPNELYSLNVPNFSNVMEFGIRWSDIGSPFGVDIVSINAFFRNVNDPLDVIKDYMPDKGNGHVRVFKNNRYIGPPPLVVNQKEKLQNSLSTSRQSLYDIPFD